MSWSHSDPHCRLYSISSHGCRLSGCSHCGSMGPRSRGFRALANPCENRLTLWRRPLKFQNCQGYHGLWESFWLDMTSRFPLFMPRLCNSTVVMRQVTASLRSFVGLIKSRKIYLSEEVAPNCAHILGRSPGSLLRKSLVHYLWW